MTVKQRIFNAYASQECERLHGIHQLLSIDGRLREEFPLMWSWEDRAAWGFNWGICVGWREIMYGQFVNLGQMTLNYDTTIPKLYPETAGTEAGTAGFQEYNELNSGVIEVAEDGKSCRASWFCHGMQYTHFKPNGSRYGANTMERYGADFIYDEKDGHWKFLHEQVASDGACLPFDTGNWANDSFRKLLEHGPDAPGGSPPPCSDPSVQHLGYSAITPVQQSVDAPKPYQTLNTENSYMPLELRADPELFQKVEHGKWVLRDKKD